MTLWLLQPLVIIVRNCLGKVWRFSNTIQCFTDPKCGTSFDPLHYLNSLCRRRLSDVVQEIESFWSCSFIQDDFCKLHLKDLLFFNPIGIDWMTLVVDHASFVPLILSANPKSSISEKLFKWKICQCVDCCLPIHVPKKTYKRFV